MKDSPPGSGPDSARAGVPRGPEGQLQRGAHRDPDSPDLPDGPAPVTVRVNAWAAVPFLFLAVRVSGYTPAAAFLEVPEIVAVPSPLSANFTPDGSRPVRVILGAGSPVAVTVKVKGTPNAAVAAEPLVKAGP